MIIQKEIETGISHYNIEYYKSIGYLDVKCNNRILIPVEHLPKESNLKILVKCDVCETEKMLAYQKYIKNTSKYNIYTCNTICSSIKNKKTYLLKHGYENYVNIDKLRETVKIKYDYKQKIEEERGTIFCSRCGVENTLKSYVRKNNGRYRKVCIKCRTITSIKNRKLRIFINPELEKEKELNSRRLFTIKNIDKIRERRNRYYKTVLKYREKYKYAWRGVLKSYLSRINKRKDGRTNVLLGYSHIEFKIHIESQFIDNMSWENHNILWQVDHIIPIALFSDYAPVNIVNSLKNLRPLDKKVNLSSGIKNIDNLELLKEFKNYLK